MINNTNNYDELPDSAFVRVATVAKIFGNVNQATIKRWAAAGKFPQPRKVSSNVLAWSVAELRAYQRQVLNNESN